MENNDIPPVKETTGIRSDSSDAIIQGSPAITLEGGDQENSTTTDLNGIDLERGAIVTARGTVDGLVIRIDGNSDDESINAALRDFLISRKKFLSGNQVSIEWMGVKPEDDKFESTFAPLFKDYNVDIKSSRLRESVRVLPSIDNEGQAIRRETSSREGNQGLSSNVEKVKTFPGRGEGKNPSLFDGIGGLSTRENQEQATRSSGRKASLDEDSFLLPTERANLASDSALWDDPDTRIIYSTLRSGQKIESEHSIVVFGDVNSGAEVVAGGDVIVLGTLRGIAHAGAYDENGGGRIIFAISLIPTQLRIGSIITRGQADSGKVPEIARVDGDTIMVDTYHSRTSLRK